MTKMIDKEFRVARKNLFLHQTEKPKLKDLREAYALKAIDKREYSRLKIRHGYKVAD